MDAAPAQALRHYPGIGHAALLTLAIVILQFVLGVPITLIGMVGRIDLEVHPMMMGLVNLAAFVIVLGWGLRMSRAP